MSDSLFGTAAAPDDAVSYHPTAPVRNIIIDATGNLTLRLYREDENATFISAHGEVTKGELLATLKVNRDVLMKNSSHMTAMLRPNGPWRESGAGIVDIGEVEVVALEFWLRFYHDAMEDSSYSMSIKDLFGIICVSRIYFFHLEKLNTWFEEWIKRNGGENFQKFDIDDLRQLLFPCHEFDHAKAFAHATRKVVYEVAGHTAEVNPTRHRHLHLEHRIITALNAARGSLRTKIHERIYAAIDQLLDRHCGCKEACLFTFLYALKETGAWPLEKSLHGKDQISIQAVLVKLRTFTYEPLASFCGSCSKDLATRVVLPAIKNAQSNFDGLCLDCIDKPERRSWDYEYDHYYKRKVWTGQQEMGIKCRFQHDQPSWYFSWLARKQEGSYFSRAMEARKRKKDEMN